MNSKWYHISTGHFGYPQPEKDFEYLNQTYIPDIGCPTCNIGKIQNHPFRFRNEPKTKHSQFIGLNWIFDQIFIREHVKNEFEKNNLTGIYFSHPVIHKSGIQINSVYQLHVDTLLPQGLIDDNLETEICEMPKDKEMLNFLKAIDSESLKGPFCGQKKYNFPQNQKMKFRKNIFTNMPDFVRTNEWFGSGGSANRPIIISEKVKEIIEKNKWRVAFLNSIELI
ncbi:hypothetical protein L9Z41_10875 [Leptospira noguchii]|uniref:hypothetical protein n=1 Tax=Leptospira noguchii TaxID=28182 RepID=UPI000773A688|nr:hypothetical protein [Leptospira noguchii]MCH1912426.1 hypothetical protein [Leptospira noguchii]MCH1916123.1 hypothetical protein [Leptospira noguchii]UOG63506.1 hypothetical protein MAL04_14750 [Leptospira noguchii]